MNTGIGRDRSRTRLGIIGPCRKNSPMRGRGLLEAMGSRRMGEVRVRDRRKRRARRRARPAAGGGRPNSAKSTEILYLCNPDQKLGVLLCLKTILLTQTL